MTENVSYTRYDPCDSSMTEKLLQTRLDTLREVFCLGKENTFTYKFQQDISNYFVKGKHFTILALSDGEIISCATCCKTECMPTVSHPTGIRGHIMGVYTKPQYRRQGIAKKLLLMIIDEAKRQGITELSLDATADGVKLYESLGFHNNNESMIMSL